MAGAIGLFYVEHETNPKIRTLLDTVWWAVATVTTVGYGDISPVTPSGKIIGIVLMILGTAVFWSYTGLFAETLITEEFEDFNSELKLIESRLNSIRRAQEEKTPDTKKLLNKITTDLKELKDAEELTSKKEDDL